MIWRAYFETNYEVSDEGQVRNSRTGNVLKLKHREPTIRRRDYGHLYVNIWIDGKVRTRFVHRMVLEVFAGVRPDGAHCRHIDGDSTNNRLSNLAWGTPRENGADGGRLGRLSQKLTREDVEAIRSSAGSQRAIARRYGVSHIMVGKIQRRENWAWL